LIHRTRIGLEMGFINLEIYGSEKYLFANFNELVRDVEQFMARVADFVNVPYSSSMTYPTRLEHEVTGNNFDGNKFSKVTTHNVDRWKERISKQEAQIIEFHLGDLMQEFGYSLMYDKRESARSASDFYKWKNYKYFFSDRFDKL
ncbi:MAG: hypothetical protein HQ521_17480, partial [Bacteroidetes bacterium]|nr:hypothetical protein [Bacteroidota bacterium]